MKCEILIFEGSDGSGKSTLICNLMDYLYHKHFKCLLIGKESHDSLAKISRLLENKNKEISTNMELKLRYDRELEKIKLINTNHKKYHFILLDRSILSILTRVSFYEHDKKDFQFLTNKIVNGLGVCTLIYCHAPFEISWKRIASRMILSKQEMQGKRINKKMHELSNLNFEHLNYSSIKKIKINTNMSIVNSLNELVKSLELSSEILKSNHIGII